MRIFAIRDGLDPAGTDIAYLFYYEQDQRFYIELPDDADPWNTPLILSSVLEQGSKTVNAYWSRIWVQQRIVPAERQNIGQILKENGLDSYDEFSLLLLAEGRCAQDDYYIAEIEESAVPRDFAARAAYKVEDVVPLDGKTLLVFFRNGEIKRCGMSGLLSSDRIYAPLLQNDSYFQNVSIQTGGYGVCWGDDRTVEDSVLYGMGEPVSLRQDDFAAFVRQRVVTTAEAAKLLDCSRQNIDDLVRRGKLHPVKESAKSKLFLKSEIIQRLWK